MRRLWDFFFGTSLYLTFLERKLVEVEARFQAEEQIGKMTGTFYPTVYSEAFKDVAVTKAEILRITTK